MIRTEFSSLRAERRFTRVLPSLLVLFLLMGAMALSAQDQQPAEPDKPKPTQPAPAGAGGPQGDIGPIAVPRKTAEPTLEPAPPPKTPEGMPDFSLRVDVPNVNVDVMVRTKDGMFIPGLGRDNFRVLEDGVPQPITSFAQAEAPITAVLLVEFAANNYYFMLDSLRASYSFADQLKKDDWVAVIAYDLKPTILQDFTQDKRLVYTALNRLRIPGFSETSLFDALYDTLDRLDGVEGRKYVILVSTGYNSFSRINLDTVFKKIKATHDVTIFSIATGEAYLQYVDARAGMSHGVRLAMMDYLQGKNQMNAFAKMTGGRLYVPRFAAEFPEIFHDIGASIRNQYKISYRPTNSTQDGSWRKIKVELVAPNGGPLKVVNEKGKEVKYEIIAREGYNAKREVE